MSFSYQEGLSSEDRERYLAKLHETGLEKCPFKEPADAWTNNPKEWPAIEYSDVYNYLIKSPRLFSTEAMENYRSLDAHSFFLSGWVQTVFHKRTTTGHYVLKADVKPSYRVTEDPHHPWVVVKKTGPVVAAHCDCKAGLGESCSHVGSLLFKMEAAVRLGFTTSACTDVPCAWNACFTKNVEPAKVSAIKFYRREAKEKCLRSKKKAKTIPAPSTLEEQQSFINSLSSLGNKCVALSAWDQFADQFSGLGPVPQTNKLPACLRYLYKENSDDLEECCSAAEQKIRVSKEEVAYVDESTRNQASSSVWHEQRIGRITASTAGDCLKTDQTRPAVSLIKKICQHQQRNLRVPSVLWGNEHEEDAFRLYVNVNSRSGIAPDTPPIGTVFMNSSAHSEAPLTVRKSGFVICGHRPFFGASPDGIINCECCGVGVLEIKCPYSLREKPMSTILGDTSFCLSRDWTLKRNHKYFAQVQFQMYVCNAAYADFVVWSPQDCAFVRVPRDPAFIQEMVGTLETFWKTNILPELVTRRMELGKPGCSHDLTEQQSSSQEGTSSVKVYCLCKTCTDLDNMVGCDRCDEWFHPRCIGLKGLPKSKRWYCRPCRKGMSKTAS